MGLLGQFGIEVSPQPYHGQVFRFEEVDGLVASYGLPLADRPASYDGHQRADFEHYIEVQVWSETPLATR